MAVTSGGATEFSPAYRRWLLTLLLLVYASSFLDRSIIAILAEPIKRSMALSDLQIGLLGGLSFALFYTLLGIPIARLAERFNRVWIIGICIALWSAMTMLCGTASSYLQLLLYRIGVGVGEAGCSPPSQSLIADHYPAHKRASALALFSLGVPIGATLAGLLGGWLAQTYDWRVAFFVVGAPGVVLALLMVLTLREPMRGLSEAQPYTGKTPGLGKTLGTLFGKRSFIHVAAGCAIIGFGNFAINGFMPPYLIRNYGMSFAEAGTVFGLINGASGALGTLIGGYLVNFAVKFDSRWYVWSIGLAALIATPIYILAFFQPTWELAAPLIFVSFIGVSLWIAPTFAVVQNMVEPRMRATAAAVILLIANIIGQGLGPTFMGWLSDVYAQNLFTLGRFPALCPGGIGGPGASAELAKACLSASALGIKFAILSVMVTFVWGGLHYLRAGKTLKRDLIASLPD